MRITFLAQVVGRNLQGGSLVAVPIALLAAASVIAPAPALGATVSRSRENPDVGEYSIDVANTGNDDNDLLITRRTSHIVVRERGFAELRAGQGCSRRAHKEVWCSRTAAIGVYVNLAGGDDRLDVRLPQKLPPSTFFEVQVFGGSGRDRISARFAYGVVFGDSGDDVIEGGAGDDYLVGGRGRDRLYGRRGNDDLDGDRNEFRPDEAKGDDLLDGGRGHDTASWEFRSTGVVADLTDGYGGGAHELDTFRSIENLSGGGAADVLRGDGRRNVLAGGRGSDLLIGRAGDDLLNASESGPTEIGTSPGADRVRCGPGFDTARAGPNDRVAADCEQRTSSRR